MVDSGGTLVGHAGFHRPPTSMDAALDDPTYDGDRPPSTGGVVELGYTVLGPNRGQGLATEAVNALLESAHSSGVVTDVLATVEPTNAASLAVLDRIGGFSVIGTCRDEQGEPELVLHRRLI